MSLLNKKTLLSMQVIGEHVVAVHHAISAFMAGRWGRDSNPYKFANSKR